MPTTEELHRRGVAAMNAGRFSQASALLERALAQSVDADLRARVELTLALVRVEQGRVDEGLPLLLELDSREGLSDGTRGLVHSQLALAHMLRGEVEAALDRFARAVPLLDEALPLGRVHLNRGNVHLQRGELTAARQDFELARHHFEQAGDPLTAAKAAHNLGYTQLLAGDLIEALRAMDDARPVLGPQSPVMRAVCDQDRAEVLLSAGLVGEGRAALRDAARAYAARRLHQYRADAELALARTSVHVDPEHAMAAARTARRLYERTGSDAWRVRADAVVLAAEVELGRSGPSLIARADGLGRDLEAQGLRWGAVQVRLQAARVLVRRGRYEEARARLAGLRLPDGAPLGVRLLSRTVRVELARAQRRRVAALQHVRAGLADLHAWQSTFGSLDLQTGVVGQGRRLGIHGLAVAVETGSPEVLHEWSERARMLAARITPVRPPADQELADDLTELRRLHAGGDGVQVPAPRRDTELRRRVRERAWRTKGSGEVTEPAPLEEVRRGLGSDAALVAWVIAGDRLVALVVTDEVARIHELGSAVRTKDLLAGLLPDLDVAASDLPGSLATVVRRGLAVRLEDLGNRLVAPLLADVGDRRVVATPSGGLAGMPWSLLPGLVGRPVTVATSATSWLAQQQDAPVLSRAGFVAGPRVARAEAEVTAAASRWPDPECLTGEAARADAVSRMAGRVDVLHIAAHGRHSADNPLFSGLELVAGPWFGYDIDLLPQVPQVVVLSACEVGRSSVRFGEELIGMTAAWLHAGVRCVVASPAAVNDAAAHDALTAMHTGLEAGLDPAAALAAAVPPAGPDAAPAPFVCFGAGW